MGKGLDTSRAVVKVVENASYAAAVGVLASTLEVVPALSDSVKAFSEAVLSVLPDPVTVTGVVPGLGSLLTNNVIAQNIGLMLDLGGIALAARFIAFLLRIAGAQRGKIEKALAGSVKLGAGGILAAGGMNHLAFDGETVDTLKWLLPFVIENGGNIPEWLASGDQRLQRSAIASTVLGTALAAWGVMQDFGGYRKLKKPKPIESSDAAVSL